MTSKDQPIVVRTMRPNENRLYLDVVNSAIRGLAANHYPPDTIAGWLVPMDDGTLADFDRNEEHEIRLIAELNREPVAIGALVVERSELRACYVRPEAARRGCGSAVVREIERIAREHGLKHLELAASLNAEPFYHSLGYRVREHGTAVLRNGHRMAAVWMEKDL
jgi:putative acetyltransferase